MASRMMQELRSEMSDRPMELTEYEASGIEKLGGTSAVTGRGAACDAVGSACVATLAPCIPSRPRHID